MAEADITLAEERAGAKLPTDLKTWLQIVGYGDINEDLSFRFEWLRQVEQGELKGAVLFAQDGLGNFYAYVPSDERIVFFSRSAPEYSVLAPSFRAFMEELERRDYETEC
ncbi:MAG: SMI1/KNR4 family protein [Burkholderiaceae bacterium]